MKLAVCIQAQDTGRILFVKERQIGPDIDWGWTWLETAFQLNWINKGINGLTREICRWIKIDDVGLEWFVGKRDLNIVHIRVPEERRVYAVADDYQWSSLFEFPEKIHPFIKDATSDLLFLDSLVSQA